MSDRPIQQIIGWRWHDRMRAWVPPELDNGLDSLTRPYTADDLLAWLKTQPRFVSVSYNPDIYDVPTVRLASPGLWLHADTLLEVLEWAVTTIDKEGRRDG